MDSMSEYQRKKEHGQSSATYVHYVGVGYVQILNLNHGG